MEAEKPHNILAHMQMHDSQNYQQHPPHYGQGGYGQQGYYPPPMYGGYPQPMYGGGYYPQPPPPDQNPYQNQQGQGQGQGGFLAIQSSIS